MVEPIVIYNNDLIAKIIFFFVLMGYAIYFEWKNRQIKYKEFEDSKLSVQTRILFSFVFSKIMIFFFPLILVTMLHINVTLDEVIVTTLAFYSILFVITFVTVITKGVEWIFKFLGIGEQKNV